MVDRGRGGGDPRCSGWIDRDYLEARRYCGCTRRGSKSRVVVAVVVSATTTLGQGLPRSVGEDWIRNESVRGCDDYDVNDSYGHAVVVEIMFSD